MRTRSNNLGTLAVAAAFIVMTLVDPMAKADFQFRPGDFYGTNETSKVYDFSSSGSPQGSLTLPYSGVRGVAYGLDGYLYVVVPAASPAQSISVVAIDASGVTHATYTLNGFYVLNNTSFGKISFDKQGYFYVGGNFGFARFTVGNTNSGTAIFNAQQGMFDVEPLPDGNLLGADNSALYEMTTTGSIVKTLNPRAGILEELRGASYDPVDGTILATQLGAGAYTNKLMKLNAGSGALLATGTLTYGENLIVTPDGTIAASAQGQAPAFYNQSLVKTTSFGGTTTLYFMTQLPEPASLVSLAVPLALLTLWRRSRQTGHQYGFV